MRAAAAGEIDDQLALGTAGDIGAGDRRNREELAPRPGEPALRGHTRFALQGFAPRPAFSLRPNVHRTFPLRAAASDRRPAEVWTRACRGASPGEPPSLVASVLGAYH